MSGNARDGVGGGPARGGAAVRRSKAARGRIVLLLVVFLLATVAIICIGALPPRSVPPSRPHLLEARELSILARKALTRKASVRGLGYMVPRGEGADSVRDALRNAGMLQAYSEPPDRVVFCPEGSAQFLPLPPKPGGSRVPGSVSRGNRANRRVALTFDDGYYRLGELVDLLVQLRVPATLFPAGAACTENREAVLKAARCGLEIANHSWSHPQFTKLPDDAIARQLQLSDEEVRKICGTEMAGYFRPPYGDCDDRVVRVAGRLGYLVVMWSEDTLDWSPATTAGQLLARATEGIQNGDIILMHSHGPHTIESLPTIVKSLRDQGFLLTTVSGVLAP